MERTLDTASQIACHLNPLQRDNELLHRIIDALNYPFYVIDASTYEILLINEAARGDRYKPGTACHKLTHHSDTPCQSKTDPCPLEIVRRTGESAVVEHTHFDKHNNATFVDVHAHPIKDESGNVVQMIEYSIDVTEKKRAEQALIAAKEEAERSAKAKTEFLANMSHEIRTPMNGVVGMTTLLLDSTLNEEQREFAETIQSSADALLGIINDVLDFSKIESGSMELEQEPFLLRECIEDATDMINRRATEKNLELAVEIASDVPTTIVGDVTRIRQVLLNLLSNAVKFTEEGEISVTVAVADRSADCSDYILEIGIRDSGIGIPADKLDHIFDKFTQADASVTRKFGGTGLGLAISKRLSELMGGGIRVESEPGEGTTFTFHLKAEVCSDRMIPTAEPPDLRSRKILLVDDNSTNLRVLGLQLKAWGATEIALATCGSHALDLLRTGEKYDLGILDFQMPGMDGMELAEQIHKLELTPAIPLVLLSSIGQHEDREAMSRLFRASLYKPAHQKALIRAIRGALELEQNNARSAGAAKSEIDGTIGHDHPLRILLADDNKVNQVVAKRMLEKMGYAPVVAGNGNVAIEKMREAAFDVILMDLQMPEKGGLEASREIRSTFPTAAQPRIIALTASVLERDRQECTAAGMNGFLSKPIKPPQLADALREAWNALNQPEDD